MAVLPIDVTKTNADVIELLTSIDDQFFMWLTQSVTSGTEILNEAATAARIAGYLAGLPVNTSMTNKTISDITAINEDYGTLDDGGATQYQLTDNGATLLTVKDRQNQIYGIVSAVTGSHFVDDTGQKPYVESHAMRTLCFCCNYLNVNDMLGSTDFTTTQLAVNAEIEQRISDLEGVVADDIQYSTEFDEDNNEVLYEDISSAIWYLKTYPSKNYNGKSYCDRFIRRLRKMAIKYVNILINGLRIARATKYSWDYKQSNDVEDTFDGPVGTPANYGVYTVKLSRLVRYDPNFEAQLQKAIEPGSTVPIVIQDPNPDGVITDTYTGCMLDTLSGSKDPKKAASEDFSFSALSRSRVTAPA